MRRRITKTQGQEMRDFVKVTELRLKGFKCDKIIRRIKVEGCAALHYTRKQLAVSMLDSKR